MTTLDQEKMDYIVALLKNIKYGSLVITIHDSQITQVDSLEKNGLYLKMKLQIKN